MKETNEQKKRCNSQRRLSKHGIGIGIWHTRITSLCSRMECPHSESDQSTQLNLESRLKFFFFLLNVPQINPFAMFYSINKLVSLIVFILVWGEHMKQVCVGETYSLNVILELRKLVLWLSVVGYLRKNIYI